MPEPTTLTADTFRAQIASDPVFWNNLIDEKLAADFIDVTQRTMQALRQRGGGPQFVRISARCVRYRRIDLKAWADARLRRSTSNPGSEPA